MEADDVRAHLAGCETCRAEVEALRPAVDTLALTGEEEVDAVTAARMKRRLLAQIAPRRTPVWPAYAVALAACLALVFTTVENIALQSGLTRLGAQVADLAAGDARRYEIPDGTVVVRGPHAYIVMNALPALPAGHVFETWTLAKGSTAMAPSTLFIPRSAQTIVQIPNPPVDLAAVAVSVEPAGGSRQPTTKPLFVRTL